MTQRGQGPRLELNLDSVFGSDDDSIEQVARRARERFGDGGVVVWEGDAATFEFTFVSPHAEHLLGYAASRWTSEPTFWGDVVVHPDDRADAIAYCALATGRCRDHVFDYRAVAEDGQIVWLRDYVKVIRSARGVAERLRGLMIDVTEEKREAGVHDEPPSADTRAPTREELLAEAS